MFELTFTSGFIAVITAAVVTYYSFYSFFRYHVNQRLFSILLKKANIGIRAHAQTKEKKTELFKHILDYKKKVGREIKILDVGAGTEENADFLPPDSALVALDPNPHFEKEVEVNVKKAGMSAEFVLGVAQDMPFKDEEFDIVISTVVMCSVVEIEKAMSEIRRVLKPGGLFLFLEHVRADRSTWTWVFQFPVDPLLWLIGDGCSCRKQTANYINSAGFVDVKMERFSMEPFIAPCRPCIIGHARK